MVKIKSILESIGLLFEKAGKQKQAIFLKNVANANEEIIWEFLISDSLWGGAGSIADQALIDDESRRNVLEKYLIDLGEIQIKENRINARTEMWVQAFNQWHA